jgi:hypothetical protein
VFDLSLLSQEIADISAPPIDAVGTFSSGQSGAASPTGAAASSNKKNGAVGVAPISSVLITTGAFFAGLAALF